MSESSEQAFVAVLMTHQKVVHTICRVYAADSESRRDLFQEIALQLWRAWPQYKGHSKISTWMYRIGLNTAISQQRKKVLNTVEITDMHHHLSAKDDGQESEQVTLLYEAIQQLEQVDKALAILLLEDYSYDEISKILGQTTNNIRVKAHRLREKLRSILTDTHYEQRPE